MSIIKNEVNIKIFFEIPFVYKFHSFMGPTVLIYSLFFADLVLPKLIHMVWVGSSLPLEYYKGPLSAVQYNAGTVPYTIHPGCAKCTESVLILSYS